MPAATATAPVASTEEIRSHFPALGRRHGGQPVAYFDGPGGLRSLGGWSMRWRTIS